jgi:hypothetical protein
MDKINLHNWQEIIDKCKGCNYVLYSPILKKNICASFMYPEVKWWFGKCPQATHINKDDKK